MKTTYTIERLTQYTDEFFEWVQINGPEISKLFEHKFNFEKAAVEKMIDHGVFLIGRRNGEIRGLHISWLFKSPLDTEVKILQQQLFYVIPDSGRMAYYLFQKFIDIGKLEANHIITMLTRHTNVKPDTLRRMGFEQLEVLFRLEV